MLGVNSRRCAQMRCCMRSSAVGDGSSSSARRHPSRCFVLCPRAAAAPSSRRRSHGFVTSSHTQGIGVVCLHLAAGRICDCRWGCGRGRAQSLRTLRGAHGTVLRFRWRGRGEERATSRDLGFSPSAATRAKDMDIFACARMIGRLRYVCKNVTIDLVLSSPAGVGAAWRSIRAFKDR